MSGVPVDAALLERARAWAAEDPDEATAAELRALLERAQGGDAAAAADLADRFAGALQFGTAGLRGALGAGPNRMNRAVVVRAAAGLASFLLAERPAREGTGPDGGPGGSPGGSPGGAAPEGPPSVVVGYDARHGSAAFARDTAAVMTGAGLRARVLPRPLPTPVLAFAVRSLRADAGVMVTASHNPPQDNGYKVYLGGVEGGSQIVPPADQRIAAAIAAAGPLAGVPRPDAGWEVLGDDVLEDYLAAAARQPGPGAQEQPPAGLRIVLTPLHGVGGAVAREALRRAGFPDVAVVPEQAEPDPDFPTVAFPNPEEPGAIDLALALARERGADLVLAVDPDADRCAVAVPDEEAAGGPVPGWRTLTGDELGSVLGEHVARAVAGRGGASPQRVLASSLVSSRLLGRIAAAHGLGYAQTLTGFKWISRVPGLVFGYEEAIGYCVDPSSVRDKDGVATAVRVARIAAGLAARGRTLLDELDDLARAHGLHATDQLSVRVQDLGLIAGAMARLRALPPTALGGSAVVEATDLAEGDVATTGLPPTDGLRYRTADGAQVVVRPSGTEPKLKCYLEVVLPVPAGAGREELRAARRRAHEALAALRADVAAALDLPA
ncbi:phospho-sugar mutase [Quadrisphaera sp. DSM 44207]|uniref:phospho-sugar mutase n=1 Tax=Quadrisphaera sp. DSM 44207 TaxID=1881057 RepID=UPI000888D090|nr:phospho-sugar mutase [Quadrisphaera sp. DSM 44207]SDQ11626.1 phosphomannomutase [Quadrisphaera sp. DSM 44207]